MLTKAIYTASGPNVWKVPSALFFPPQDRGTETDLQVILILEELDVPYEIKSIRFEDAKKPPFIDLNPNGRSPGTFRFPLISVRETGKNADG